MIASWQGLPFKVFADWHAKAGATWRLQRADSSHL